jgi:hypothetical protein
MVFVLPSIRCFDPRPERSARALLESYLPDRWMTAPPAWRL